MIKLFDTHTHLYLPEFDTDRGEVMSRAFDSGVSMMLLPNVDVVTVEPMKRLHTEYPTKTVMAMGLHPTEINGGWEKDIRIILAEIETGQYKAIGEIGIDLYWDKTYLRQQMEAFDTQVGWATDNNLPIIIHCREGLDQTLEILDNYKGQVIGVFHSFGGSRNDVDRIRKYGDFYFGINGIVTFKNSRLKEVIPHIGLQHILLETDAPYLAPVPYRGKRNESSYIVKTAEVIADSIATDLNVVTATTYSNAEKMLGIIE